ncbi:hypothetical protein QQP08_016252 [Theobroma cacao]|nr:hypothetical protein QQP08_015551 [Theobroma cacao]WRX23765.1 hypothetical protein QQP08_016252 [Theobroma cacao]
MTQELSIPLPNSESRPGSESSTVISVSIADPFVLLRIMMEAFYYLLEHPIASILGFLADFMLNLEFQISLLALCL